LDNAFVRAFRRSPSGIAGLVVVFAVIVIAIIGPPLFKHDATTPNFLHVNEGPSWSYPLGTDQIGRDIFAQLMVGTRLSILLALGAAGMALVIGVLVGASAAVAGPRTRPGVLRFIDVMLSFPGLLKAIFITVLIGRGGIGAMIGVGIAAAWGIARVASTLALSTGGREYISAARVVGVRGPRLVFRYVLPNIAEPLIVAFSVVITTSILTVSALSFLGLGVQAPSIDWGSSLTQGVQAIYLRPASALGPAAAIAISAIAWGFMGEAAARAMNPLLWTAGRGTAPGGGAAPPPVVRAETGASIPPPVEPAADNPVLDVRGLVVSFPGPAHAIDVVKGISFSVPEGEVVGIVGESGSGKTMTALAIAQLTPYPGRVGGTVSLEGRDVATLPRRQLDRLIGTKVAIVYQDPLSSLNPALRIGAQLTDAVRVHGGLSRRQARELAARALREVNIPAAEQQLDRFPHELSGGMRQRAMIARGLMKNPTLLLADEPTTALDVTIQAQVMDLLGEVNQARGTAVLLISHNLALVSQNCHRVLVMYAGRIVEDLDVNQLKTSPMHPYTRALLGAVPELGHARDQPLASIPGEVPDIGSPPSGCAFHPRCPLATPRCSVDLPEFLPRPDGRRVACHVANEDLDGTGSLTSTRQAQNIERPAAAVEG
jgi:oligopeptide/dipeptide ABC transporter ATP-binding protein